MATHSSILVWKISWTVEPTAAGCKESVTTERLTPSPFLKVNVLLLLLLWFKCSTNKQVKKAYLRMLFENFFALFLTATTITS